jgi:REP element-mobilizing transposase RayT
MEKEFPHRKPTRLQGYNYSTPGAYFITICTKDKKKILSSITVGADAHIGPENRLSRCGIICEEYIRRINGNYENISVDKYVIMPNHIHMILLVSGTMWASSPTVGIEGVVSTFKTLVSKEIGYSIWQRSYHDHIIRGEEDYREIWKYIDTNVLRWRLDRFYEDDGAC